jgi:hypothetical protein
MAVFIKTSVARQEISTNHLDILVLIDTKELYLIRKRGGGGTTHNDCTNQKITIVSKKQKKIRIL